MGRSGCAVEVDAVKSFIHFPGGPAPEALVGQFTRGRGSCAAEANAVDSSSCAAEAKADDSVVQQRPMLMMGSHFDVPVAASGSEVWGRLVQQNILNVEDKQNTSHCPTHECPPLRSTGVVYKPSPLTLTPPTPPSPIPIYLPISNFNSINYNLIQFRLMPTHQPSSNNNNNNTYSRQMLLT